MKNGKAMYYLVTNAYSMAALFGVVKEIAIFSRWYGQV